MAEAARADATDEQFEQMAACQERLEYQFQNQDLLHAALTHASGAEHRLASNERLEFLGDAILGAIVCEMLYRQYPDYLEGDLTKIKSIVVSRQTCAKISDALGLEEFLILGKGMTTHPSVPSSLLADVLESLIAAVYLDGGSEAASQFVSRLIEPEIVAAVEGDTGGNYKSLLQQVAQREHGTTPTYQLLDEKGPDHSKCFKICAQVGEKAISGCLGTKQERGRAAGCTQRTEPTEPRSPAFSVRLRDRPGTRKSIASRGDSFRIASGSHNDWRTVRA